MPRALIVVQCFPPLLKNAGGVSKRYLTLCRALIDGLGWQVTLMTPVNISLSREEEVTRWMRDGSLIHLPARGVRITSASDGVAVFLDLMSFVNAGLLVKELCIRRGYDLLVTDDTPWRMVLLLLARAFGVPSVASTHTDITHMKSFKGGIKVAWYVHMWSTRIAAVHATVSRIFGDQLIRMYSVPLGGVWPPILWSAEFKSEPSAWVKEAAEQRATWLEKLREQGCEPKAIMLSAGRWSAEKRIHLIIAAMPKDCALVIVGDGTSEYAHNLENSGPPSGRPNVLPLRKMLNGAELRTAYAACDLFLSASNFETLGNTIIEAMCSGTPCGVQPAQGHLEFVKDGENSWFVNFDDMDEARSTLTRIVASGLDELSLNKVIPSLSTQGYKFRTGNFACDFDSAIITPALAAGQRQKQGGFVEYLKRTLSLICCILMWIVLRILTRLAFVFLQDPEMEVLGPLGSAHDDMKAASVLTYPCLRSLFGMKPQTDGVKVDGLYEEDRKAYAGLDATGWAHHFEPARTKAWWNKRL